jgi:hypothetical protein
VDNTIGEDWRDVEVSLVAGAPQSFIQNISQPYYGRRAVVPMPSAMLLAPQTHQASLGDGAGSVRGTVRDSSGSVIPGATVRLMGSAGIVASAVSGSDGRYEVTAPAGVYSLRFELPGFSPRVFENWNVPAGTPVQQDVTMNVGSVSEAVTVTGDAVSRSARTAGRGFPGGVIGGVVGGLPNSPPPPPPAPMPRDVYEQARNLDPQAAAASLGDLFEYRIKEPISLRKNQSALPPLTSPTSQAAQSASRRRLQSGCALPLAAARGSCFSSALPRSAFMFSRSRC